jgi:hypothetical protein
MLGKTHQLVANLSMACLNQKERHVIYPRWGGIESGATLSDEFRIMWEIDEVGSDKKQLVHRCYVDSKDAKNHGCITRALNHAEGCIGFIETYSKEDSSEEEFLENLGVFMGITCHHIADLCTPVHVGHIIDFQNLGYSSLSIFHNKVERDIFRCQNKSSMQFSKPKLIDLSEEYFWNIAIDTYKNIFLKLEDIYKTKDELSIIDVSSQVISNAVKHTTDVWHTILHKTQMTKRKWTM